MPAALRACTQLPPSASGPLAILPLRSFPLPVRPQESARVALRERQLREQRYAHLNGIKIHNQWRKIMRMAKVEELRREIEILSQNHEREVDRKDAIMQVRAPLWNRCRWRFERGGPGWEATGLWAGQGRTVEGWRSLRRA
jgi:hypothetical protein